jgi:hypothetical protein
MSEIEISRQLVINRDAIPRGIQPGRARLFCLSPFSYLPVGSFGEPRKSLRYLFECLDHSVIDRFRIVLEDGPRNPLGKIVFGAPFRVPADALGLRP